METYESGIGKTVSSWIASLAISVICCAVLFVIFAQYVVDIKKNIAAENEKLTIMDSRQEVLLNEIKSLHRMVAVNAPAAVTTPASGVAVGQPAVGAPVSNQPVDSSVSAPAPAPVTTAIPEKLTPPTAAAPVVPPAVAPVTPSQQNSGAPSITVPTIPAKP